MSSFPDPASLFFASILLLAVGCGGATVSDDAQGDAFEQLSAIGQSYFRYVDVNRKPPRSREDLTAILKNNGEDVNEIFISARDGQEFVVIWGTPTKPDSAEPIVIAYEADGQRGSRMVLTTMGAMTMSEKEFRASKFPDGHSPSPNSQ
jgi:hypothetical protein